MTDDTTPTTGAPRRWISRRSGVAVTAVGLALGSFAGGYVISHAATAASPSAAASTAPSASTGTTAPAAGTAPGGAFHPNEGATHEAGESAAREAQENAGQVPTVP